MTSKLNKSAIILAALYIIPLTGLGIDIYVPSLPAVTLYFSTSNLLAQDTISIYILGLGISQLICGNIIDHYGRRKPLLITMICYFILSLFIVFSQSIQLVTVFRLLQGICMGFSAVSARSIFLDLFSGEEYYRKASYMTIAYALGPIVAPAIGGYLQHYFGWQASFYFLSGYSLVGVFIVIFFIPETIQVRSTLNFRVIIKRYGHMLSNYEYLLGVLSLAMLYTMLMVFNLIGPFLIQSRLNYSPVVFGHLALLCGLSWFIGNVANRMLLRIPRETRINYALCIISLDIILMYVLSIFWFNLYVIVLPICILAVAASVLFSTYFVHMPTLFPTYAATASACMAGGLSLLSSSLCVFLTKVLKTTNQVPMIHSFLGLLIVCILAHKLMLKLADHNKVR